MTRRLVYVGFVLMLLMAGCGPKKVEPETSSACYPYDLQVDVQSGTMDIYWKTSCKDIISGYNIYINENPLVEKYPTSQLPETVRPFNLTPYAGDTNPDDEYEHYIAENLEDGKKYYISVRVVNPDMTQSRPSNEVVAVTGASGEIELSIRYKSDQDGYSLVKDEYVRADDIDNDLYFFSDGEGDYLNSPVKLDGFLRRNQLRKLPYEGNFADVRDKLSGLKSEPDEEKVPVKKGDWVHLRTADGANAVIKVLEISGKGEERKVRLFFVYNPLSGEMIF